MTRDSSSQAAPPSESIALYIHFPWCLSICPYCDFDRRATGFGAVPSYLTSVRQEMGWYPPIAVHSIYFGGGTPSLMSPDQVGEVLATARDHFYVLNGAEVTLEANPGDLTEANVRALLSAGVNRLSIGVQSLDDDYLRLLGRRHTAAEAVQAYRLARSGGARNVSLDLMFGLPGQTPGQWRRTLQQALLLGPEHLSCYLLTLEPSVPMGRAVRRGQMVLPDDDTVAHMYELAQDLLGQAGYRQYEISNWALPGYESRHNLTYWRCQPYIGLGAGAASYWEGRRYKNTPSVRRYIAAVHRGLPEYVEHVVLGPAESMADFLVLGLRLREGIDPSEFHRRFGLELHQVLGEELEQMVDAGALHWHGGRLQVPSDKLLISNAIFSRIMARISMLEAHLRAWGETVGRHDALGGHHERSAICRTNSCR